MANSNFVVHNGLTVGPLTIDAATGTITTTGALNVSGASPQINTGNIVAASGTASTTTTTGALVVVGGLGVSGNINVGGSVNIAGNISISGNSVSIGSTSLSVVDPIINLHSPNDNSPLTVDDGADIGILMHYYKNGADGHAAVVWANDDGFLEYYAAGNDTSNVFTGTAYGTIKSGEYTAANTTAATSSTTGAIRSAGGISTQANLYVGTGAYFANSRTISKQVTTSSTTPPASGVTKVGDQWYDTATDTLYQYLNDGTTNGMWVDITSVPYNYQSNVAVAGGTLSITGNGSVGNLTVSGKLSATATSALYADLAELYAADTNYEAGTVVVFGGAAEITQSTVDHDPRVAGVISTDPAYLMNSGMPVGTYHPVALTGRVPCRVQGPVAKGQVLVTGTEPGTAQAIDTGKFQPGVVLGKSLETITDNSVQTIEVAVGRF
jgi:hypothetical protein